MLLLALKRKQKYKRLHLPALSIECFLSKLLIKKYLILAFSNVIMIVDIGIIEIIK